MASLNCDHCLLSVPEKHAVRYEVDGQQKVFCCNGCHGVYKLIHDEGLDEFYQRRKGWTPGPPEHTEITARSFEDSVRSLGDHREIDIHLSGIRCASCIWLIEHCLSRNIGIKEIRVNYATHRARIRWLPGEISLDSVLERITSLGYVPRPYAVSQAEESLEREKKDLLIRLGTASFLSMQLMIYTTALYAGYFQGIEPSYRKVFELIALSLATPVMFYCGYPFLKNTVLGLRNSTFNMDTLIFFGSFSAYAYSVIVIFIGGEVYFDTSAMIITLILLGRFIESDAKARATRSVSALFSLQPKEARLIKAGESSMLIVPASALRVGDRIEVIPGEKVPIDSMVVDGTSEVDESMLTGEAMPVKKARGKEVFGGTMNLNGRLLVEVKRTGDDTVLAQVIRAVEDAQSRRAPIQKVSDRVVAWFVPAIVVISTATFLFWFVRGGSPTAALMNAISVMVVACPCALGLATPLSVLIGSTLLASKGILLKGGDIIEAIAHSDYISFDKTGTLTTGMPTLITTVNYGMEERSLRVLAASIERNSEHSIARALCKGVSESDLFHVDEFRAHPGRGVEGFLKGERLAIGNASFLESFGAEITKEMGRDFSFLSVRGNTVIGLALGKQLKGWFVISDELCPEAPELVEDLRRYGYHVALITGDHRSVAKNIGSKAGIS
ncbi:MAG TPA: heavy metal translocating P-type ATPase, partial [Thermodesulfovibrionales bacterium]|nr:heavy metal translocating P-type ATPase [Thermodesulfovibrionales bacterium]